jgi:hypothetical protein
MTSVAPNFSPKVTTYIGKIDGMAMEEFLLLLNLTI